MASTQSYGLCMNTFSPAVAAFGWTGVWRPRAATETTVPLADDKDAGFDSEPIGRFRTLAPELKILVALTPASQMPPPIASRALFCAGVIAFGCGMYRVPRW